MSLDRCVRAERSQCIRARRQRLSVQSLGDPIGRRPERIADVIGEEAVGEIVDELDAAAKERLGEEWWRIFDTGTFEEQQQVVREIESSYRQRVPSESEEQASPAPEQ